MAQFDGIGRIYRTDFRPKVDRSPQADPTERDKKQREKEEKHDEEPHDSVELHEDEAADTPTETVTRPKITPLDDDGLDISA